MQLMFFQPSAVIFLAVLLVNFIEIKCGLMGTYGSCRTPALQCSIIDWCICILLSQESDGSAIVWTNPRPIRSWPFSKFSGWCLTSFLVSLLLVRSHRAEIIILKRHIQGRNNVTWVWVDPKVIRSLSGFRSFYQRKNVSATLPIIYVPREEHNKSREINLLREELSFLT